ncbi:transmembrane protein 272-like [Paramormyrops kingsleyae]|uniref:transmembrane protein 272-like n=1 Tax=Paramormyrops kingsleyae TaxID=1676925 RepID=UPI003B978F0F
MENRNLLRNLPQTPKPSLPVLVLSKLIMIVLPIAQIAIGVVYMKDCPAEHYIPIYLVVTGSFSLALAVLSCLPCSQESDEGDQGPLYKLCTTWNSLVSFFLFCWFIAGNVWIYSIYAPDYDPKAGVSYCNKTLYLFAFWTTTLCYILLGLMLVGGCCMLLCLCVLGKSVQEGADEV